MPARILAADLPPGVLASLEQHKPSRAKYGRGVRRQPGVMNKLEARYAEYLEQQKAAGVVLEWHFDAVKLRLADKCFITIDFMVMLADGEIQFVDVKGFVEDDAIVKLKVAARLFPFRIFMAQKKRKHEPWKITEIGA